MQIRIFVNKIIKEDMSNIYKTENDAMTKLFYDSVFIMDEFP